MVSPCHLHAVSVSVPNHLHAHETSVCAISRASEAEKDIALLCAKTLHLLSAMVAAVCSLE